MAGALLGLVAAMLRRMTIGQAPGNRDAAVPCQDAHRRG